MRVYLDGVFDLFHRGHLECILKAKNILNAPETTELIIGIVSDMDCASYKRKPVICETDRAEIISHIKEVDEVIFPSPMYTTEEFIERNRIDYVVHSFADDKDREQQRKYFEIPIKSGKFIEIPYYDKISTTKIIKILNQ